MVFICQPWKEKGPSSAPKYSLIPHLYALG